MGSNKASVYNYFSNDVKGVFGTDKTSSTIPIKSSEFTAAVAMPTINGESNPNYKGYAVGDVLMVRNDSLPDKPAVLVLVTDVGGLPNAQIDLVDGIASRSLGMETVYDKATGKRPVGVSNSENVTISKVGSVESEGNRVQNYTKALATIKDINVNGKPISELETLLKSKGDVDFSQNVASLAPTIKPDSLPTAPQRDNELANPDDDFYRAESGNSRRKKQDIDNWLQSLPEEDRAFFTIIAALFAFIAGDAEKGNALLSGTFGTHIATPESYVKYDKETGGSLGGEAVARQLGSYNQDYQVKNSPQDWGKPTPEAIAQAMAGKIVYQEQRGDGKTSYGTLTLTNEEGKVVSFPVLTGGAGKGSLPGTANGTGAVDERYGVVIPDYTVANFRGNRQDKLAYAMGGFSFDLLSGGKDSVSIPGKDREYFRIHADGNKDGKTQGCIGCKPADSPTVIAAIKSHQDNVAFAILPSRDANNELATHFKKAPENEVAGDLLQPLKQTAAIEAAKDVAKDTNLMLATQTVRTKDGYPPKVPDSVAAAQAPAAPAPAKL